MDVQNPPSSAVGALACALCLLAIPLPARAAENHFGDWPEGTSPKLIGTRVTERFIRSLKSRAESGRKDEIRYPEIVTWYGALTYAKAGGRADLTKALVERADPLLKEETHKIPPPDHVDRNVFGALAAEVFLQSGDKRFYEKAKHFADIQWQPTEEIVARGDGGGKPQVGLTWRFDAEAKRHMEQGLSWQTRFWIDDMYMITMAQGQMFRASGERKYIDRAAKEMVAYLDKLQEPNGLFYHAPDVPFFWGRGNGWMAAGTAELLRSLPADNPDRPRILEGYRKMMAALLKHQAPDGMWRQLVDDDGSWPETSGTAMFTFALITGVKNGWLDAGVYGPAARKGWLALITYLDANSDIRDVCEGTNKKADRQYYLDRKRVTGDLHGQAPLIWCAVALLR